MNDLLQKAELKILIVQPSRLGDIIFSLPVVFNLKGLFPNSHITWLVDDRCYELLENNPYIDEIIVVPFKELKKNNLFKKIKEIIKLKNILRSKKFDISIDLHGLFKSSILVLFAKAKYKIASSSSYGMKELSWIFSKEIKSQNSMFQHTIDRHLEVVKYLREKFNKKFEIKKEFPIYLSEENEIKVNEILKKFNIKDDFITIFPGGGWLSRRWFIENYARLSDILIKEFNYDVVFIGGKPGGSPEEGIIEKIQKLMNEKSYNLSGQLTLKQLCVLLKKTKLFIGNEAGPMHIACALGTKVIGIIGPTNPSRTGPFGNNFIVVKKDIDCAPCRERNCKKMLCMKKITVEDIINAVNKIL